MDTREGGQFAARPPETARVEIPGGGILLRGIALLDAVLLLGALLLFGAAVPLATGEPAGGGPSGGSPVPEEPAGAADAPPLLLHGAHILASDGEEWIEGSDLLIEGDRIAAIGPPASLSPPPGTRVLRVTGLHLVPGLIDLHTHLLLHPYDEAPWNDQVLRESLGLRTLRAAAAARTTLEAGFTTIRDLGTEGAGFADVALRDAIDQGLAEGPRVLASTRAIVATGCYGPAGFDPRWDVPKGAQVADGPDGVRRAVREQIAAGADWIKVYADYRRRPGDPATPTFTVEEIAAAVDEAAAAGLPVAAHASSDEGIRRALDAGVQTIEHGTGATFETLRRMADAGVVLCPTVAASEAIARQAGWRGGEEGEPDRVRRSRELIGRALRAGVSIACGSDAGVFRHGDNARELELLVAYGMTPAGALACATRVAAEILKRKEDLGRLAPGAMADLAAFQGDPLRDPAALRDPLLVIARGRIAASRLEPPPAAGAVRRELVDFCDAMLEEYSAGALDSVRERFAAEAVIAMDLEATGERRVMAPEAFLERARKSLASVREFREWIAGEPVVLAGGSVACVWAPFILEADGRRAEGIDVFQLARLDGTWKIVSLSFTNRPAPAVGRRP